MGPLSDGQISTNAGGALTGNFSNLNSRAPLGTYSASGFSPHCVIAWFLNDANDVFYSNYADAEKPFGDAAGGAQMAFTNWTDPQPFSGSCVAMNTAPLLSGGVELLLTTLLAVVGVARLRRRRPTASRAAGDA